MEWIPIKKTFLLAYASLNPFPMITTSLPELYFRYRRLSCWYKWKKWFLWAMVAPQGSWKPWEMRWVRLDLLLTMRDIYINSDLNPLTHKDILKISSNGMSQMITKTISISTWVVISYAVKQGILFWVQKVDGNRQHDLNFPIEESRCRTNTSIRRNKSI